MTAFSGPFGPDPVEGLREASSRHELRGGMLDVAKRSSLTI
jgi:hypothetical protein